MIHLTILFPIRMVKQMWLFSLIFQNTTSKVQEPCDIFLWTVLWLIIFVIEDYFCNCLCLSLQSIVRWSVRTNVYAVCKNLLQHVSTEYFESLSQMWSGRVCLGKKEAARCWYLKEGRKGELWLGPPIFPTGFYLAVTATVVFNAYT